MCINPALKKREKADGLRKEIFFAGKKISVNLHKQMEYGV